MSITNVLNRLTRHVATVWEYDCDWCGETVEVVGHKRPVDVTVSTIDGERYGFAFCSHECSMAWSDAGKPPEVGRPATFDEMTAEHLAREE